MHMISASAPSDLAEYVDEGTLNAGTSLVTPAGMLVMQGNVAALRRALDARECVRLALRVNHPLPIRTALTRGGPPLRCAPDDSASSPGHAPLIGVAAKFGQRECAAGLLTQPLVPPYNHHTVY